MQLPTTRTRHAHRSTLYYTALVVSAAMIQSLDNLTLLLNTRAPVLWSPIQQVYRKRRAVVLYRVTPCLPGYKSVRVVEIQVVHIGYRFLSSSMQGGGAIEVDRCSQTHATCTMTSEICNITNTYQPILPPWRNVRHFLLTTIKIAARIILIEKSHFFLHHYLICGGNWGYFSRYMTKWFFILFLTYHKTNVKQRDNEVYFPFKLDPFILRANL